MSTDIHSKAFDDGTQIKLYILREYLKQWLPVFLNRRKTAWKKVYIYDFFAGEGSDIKRNIGSPLIILKELRPYCNRIRSEKIEVKVVFNEFLQKKSKKLNELCRQHLKECKNDTGSLYTCPKFGNNDDCVFRLVIENKDFNEFFQEIYVHMVQFPKMPRFMFLDQYGVKHVTEDIFHKLIKLERTDFIFFISSSFARRFIMNNEFQKYLKLTNQDFNEEKTHHCHRVIFKYYKSLIPPDQKFYLAPFSIKKNQNIYGLIFGTHHSLGIEKFLNVGWKINVQTGDANYDIDDEKINPTQPKLFKEFDIPNKIQLFERELKTKIEAKEIITNQEIYEFSFESGVLPKHANKVIQDLKSEGKIQKDFKIATQNIHNLDLSKID
jgi:three-Cys-motif partner protein